MVFTRFVEIGRVALISYGPDMGKLCTIIDVVDENKVLVDGPYTATGVSRGIISLRRLSLTDLTIKIPRQPRVKTLKAAFEKAEVLKNWANTNWAKNLKKKEVRAGLNDFERFKLMVAKKQKSAIIKKKLSQLRKASA